MARVIATGGAPPSRAAMAGNAFGASLGQGVAQGMDLRQSAKQLNPVREALAAQLANMDPAKLTPMQQMLQTAAQSPMDFAIFARNPQTQLMIGQIMDPPKEKRNTTTIGPGDTLVDADDGAVIATGPAKPRKAGDVIQFGSSEAKRWGLTGPQGEWARIEFEVGEDGLPVGPATPMGRFATREEAMAGSGGDEGDFPFGKGRRGRTLQHMMQLAPGYAAGTLDADQERLFLTAVEDYRQPFEDPDTGALIAKPRVPDFVEDALKLRPAPARVPPPVVRDDGTFDDAAAATQFAEFAGVDATEAIAAREAATQQAQAMGIPADAHTPPMPNDGITILEEAMAGNLTGPVPALARWATRLPGAGIDFPEKAGLPQYVTLHRDRLVRALQTNPRYAIAERQDIIQNSLDVDPRLWDTPQAATNSMVRIDQFIESLEREAADALARGNFVPGETRQHAMATLQELRSWRKYWMPERLESQPQIDQFVQQQPPGTKFTARNDKGSWRVWTVPPREGQ